ncbi:MAG: pyruvate dehydrogenase E1 component subunit beta [Parcubacteria group bacterium Gr01-1014_70]|nr:MAG: pyruvate dehydrogenase E1 component subunit beta [Parcubacteria group bacterium Gr01-1014_70]
MTYLAFLNSMLKKEVADRENLVAFGQNIAAGSYLGGLTAGISVSSGSRIINTINAENSLVGFGFGLALSGTDAIFFMRQIDFLLLAADQLVNTYNSIRNRPGGIPASFTIMTTVIDQGYEGPQSSLNNLGDFCSLAHIDAFTVTNKADMEKIIPAKLIAPGFRIIAASPRLYKTEIIEPRSLVYYSPRLDFFEYRKGDDATIVCFNLSFPYGYALSEEMQKNGIHPALFSVNVSVPIELGVILESVKKTKKLIILDDGKSMNCSYHTLIAEARLYTLLKEIIITRKLGDNWLTPNPDHFEIDYQKIIQDIV